MRRRGAVDDEACARQRLEGGGDIAVGIEIVAQARRPRTVKIASCIAQDLSVRTPNSLRVAVTPFEA